MPTASGIGEAQPGSAGCRLPRCHGWNRTRQGWVGVEPTWPADGKGSSRLENSGGLLKTLNTEFLRDPVTPLRGVPLPRRGERIRPHADLCARGHSSQNVETTGMSTHGWMDK